MSQDDVAYYTRRIDEERRRAASSPFAEVARVHLQLAAQYRQVLAAMAAEPGIVEHRFAR